MRRAVLFLLLALVLGLGASMLHERAPDRRLAGAAASLQAQVDRAAAKLAAGAAETLRRDSLFMGAAHGHGEEGQRLYRNHEVVAWTDHAPVPDATLDTSRAAHMLLPDGIYLHAVARVEGRSVHGVRRMWFQPPFENQYLRRQFDSGFRVAPGIVADTTPGLGPVVRDAAGQVMFRLEWAGDEPLPGRRAWMALLLAIAGVASGIAALWLFAARLRPSPLALLAFPVLLLGARVATLAHGTFHALAAYPLFNPTLFASSFLMPSLGDLLLNTALLLTAVLFLHRVLRRIPHPAKPWLAAVLALLLLFAAADGLAAVMVALVHDSSVSLDLFRVQNMDGYSLAALGAIGGLLLAWCVLGDALVRWISPQLPLRSALLASVAASAAFIILHHLLGQYDLVLAIWPLPALWLLERMRRRRGTIPALVLVAVLAFFTVHVLNRQTFKRTGMDLEVLAESATTREDPVIELLFGEAHRKLEGDAALAARLQGGAGCTSTELDRMVRQPYFSGYWDRYDLRLHLTSKDGRAYCSTSPDAGPSAGPIADRFEQGVPTAAGSGLRLTGRPGEEALYIGRMAMGGAQLFVEIRTRLVTDGLGFPDLLLAGSRPSYMKPGRFVRARYERGVLTSAIGPFVFPIAWHKPVPQAGLRWTAQGYDLLALGDPHGTLLVLGDRVPSWWDHVTTFSYIFLFLCLLGGLAALVSLLFRRGRMTGMGVSGKVRLGVAGFAVAGLLLFTFGMRRMLDVRQQQRSTRILEERTRGVLAELRTTLRGEDVLLPATGPYLDHLLTRLSDIFFTDLSLYAPNGKLMATSREQVFNSGLLGRRMDPRAFHRLAAEGASSFVHPEHIGTAAFSTAYMPFRNEQGTVLAYLALPYFARQAEVEQERASGYVALANLFTLLFLLSVVAAALITHWTTRPLELLRRGMERIGLGTGNEPIQYRGNDELGQLVRVYNRKVHELEESAVRLARSERESAWREMARQVAHEIKNPLTPMKLNIQHFQRTWQPGAPDARERLDRFSNNLVEQIDVLSRIAGEFSHFAQMPPAHPAVLDLAQVADAAVQLFANTPDGTVRLQAAIPLPVLADREHLMRVFNNLVNNALQAVPEGRRAEVVVSLRREGAEAVAEVRDNGTGIAEQDRERIFQPSFTTKTSGMGLGLAIVQRMVENAGGRVWFTTEEGKGTSFFVVLPLQA
ncbi:MAG: HAMP domain-containing histidine kinase [Flavobacteriales bacterium]|nr:HAMP domain-containing histidine kinase [Flavobacteriales bacterium]